jgi:hypothetical protein
VLAGPVASRMGAAPPVSAPDGLIAFGRFFLFMITPPV